MSDDEVLVARRKAAYAKLDEAIDALSELFFDGATDMPGEMPIDAVLIIGSQAITEDGHRTGATTICPRGGWQPGYITSGLIHMATSSVDGTGCNSHCCCE